MVPLSNKNIRILYWQHWKCDECFSAQSNYLKGEVQSIIIFEGRKNLTLQIF